MRKTMGNILRMTMMTTRMKKKSNAVRIPAGTYGFVESYCDDKDCDCRGYVGRICLFKEIVEWSQAPERAKSA